jgi:hypothetical protein
MSDSRQVALVGCSARAGLLLEDPTPKPFRPARGQVGRFRVQSPMIKIGMLVDALYNWQTLIAGLLALGAAVWTIKATRSTAKEQIDASQKDADRVIAATRAQTEATFKQTDATVTLDQLHDASEALAFHVMLEAAMARVLAEADWARKTYPQLMTPQATLEAMGAGQEAGSSPDAFAARQCITKGAFVELRAACVRRGGDLTGAFLDLEREIDRFAAQWALRGRFGSETEKIRLGKHAGLDEQLASIETKATALRKEAVARFSGSLPPAPPRRNGGPVTGLP